MLEDLSQSVKTNRSSEDTINYYDQHAEEYCSNTLTVDMSEFYRPFLREVSAGGRILDLGRGSFADIARHPKYEANQFESAETTSYPRQRKASESLPGRTDENWLNAIVIAALDGLYGGLELAFRYLAGGCQKRATT